jgi:hypothetical protein
MLTFFFISLKSLDPDPSHKTGTGTLTIYLGITEIISNNYSTVLKILLSTSLLQEHLDNSSSLSSKVPYLSFFQTRLDSYFRKILHTVFINFEGGASGRWWRAGERASSMRTPSAPWAARRS